MSTTNIVNPKAAIAGLSGTLPANFLNAYEIIAAAALSWPVNVYAVDLLGEPRQENDTRGRVKNVIWELRKKNKSSCRGYGFVVDISPRLVVVPRGWQLPNVTTSEYTVKLDQSFNACANDVQHRAIVAGILREAIKAHFKTNTSDELGSLWQDYNSFCQYPSSFGQEYLNCRRFGFGVKVLQDGRWTVRLTVGTMTLDGKTFKDYYDQGKVHFLAKRLETKRGERLTRDNRHTSVRVLHQGAAPNSHFKCLDLEDFDLIMRHSTLSHGEQRAEASRAVRCRPFMGPAVEVLLGELRLILTSEITQEEHSETIIEPNDREEFTRRLRGFVDGADVSGTDLRLSQTPVDLDTLESIFVLPPAVRVRGPNGKIEVLPSPSGSGELNLRQRAQERSDHIRRYGFLVERPINPMLAWPARIEQAAGKRLKTDLEFICQQQGLKFTFDQVFYNDVEDLAQLIEKQGNDTLFAILPESSHDNHSLDDTHDRIKRRLEVPSQCMHYDHTLPRKWVDRPHHEFKNAEPRLAKRIRQRYELCLLNLLVKHHWFPFAPAVPFHYNVHIGLDVGGIHNTHAMACMGYGFRRPSELLIFRPEEIPIEVQKKEPIPTDSLYRGLLGLTEFVISELRSNGLTPDFERVLFHRDGQLLGAGDAWNEREALVKLHDTLMKRGVVSPGSIWTAVEVMKGAEGWRVFRNDGTVTNPLVGQCFFPFEDENTSLICTTGAPYLTQGTACPTHARIVDIYGHSNRIQVVEDFVWQADLCFTKPDMGMSLPWVLNVADAGALQLSRSYHISGITT